MQKNIKDEKGSVSLFILLSLLFFLVIITSVAIIQKNREDKVDNEYKRIKEMYEKDVGNEETIYNEKTGKAPVYEYKRVGNIFCNSPDLSGFNPNCTYYVTYGEDGKQDKDNIPISQPAPEGWYDYENKKWANIKTTNNGNITYWTWIPRFKYKIESTKKLTAWFVDMNDKCYIMENNLKKYIDVSKYDISDAFTFNDKQLPGYWVSKYRVQEGTNNDEKDSVNQIEVDLSGFNPNCTYYVTYDNDGKERLEKIPISQPAPEGWYDYKNKKWANIMTDNNGNKTYWTYIPRYEYSMYWNYISKLNVKFVNTSVTDINADPGYSVPDSFTFNDKELKGYWVSKYRVQEGNNNDEKDSVNQIEVDLSGFNPACTYYVTYDDDGNKLREDIPISQSPPENWYDYSKKKWANVVTKGKDSNNQEQITYWTYIPRYEYSMYWNYISKLNLKFVKPSITDKNADKGYGVPDSFTFNGKELKGYWVSKYRVEDGTPNLAEFNGLYYKP